MRELTNKITALPEVDHVTTIDSLIPSNQDEKLPLIENADAQLRKTLDAKRKTPPTDAETVKALLQASKLLRRAAGAKLPRL